MGQGSEKPVMIFATSNGVGMGHLARASAIARVLKDEAEVIVVSMAGAVAELPEALGLRVEYIPGRDRNLMPRLRWDRYLKDRLVALIDETGASLLAFDGVVPYPGVISAKDARPDTTLIWVRRGLWQWKPNRHLLALQSRLMDHVIEPGDFARIFDTGPTVIRKDALLTSPVSLYQRRWAKDRNHARETLGLELNRPAVLVQLGTGDADVNQKMHAALSGLIGWQDLQVVLTKHPVDQEGRSLAPDGLDLKVVRYFPLADLLHAFDGAIAAAGYNGVHELLPAGIPTVFIPNIRGTDDQVSRARFTHEQGFALAANPEDLSDIEAKVRLLQNASVRQRLSTATKDLPPLDGNDEASIFYLTVAANTSHGPAFKVNYLRYLIKVQGTRRLRAMAVSLLRAITVAYRTIFPKSDLVKPEEQNVIFSTETRAKDLSLLIKSDSPLEHMISGASKEYQEMREMIAARAYRVPLNKSNRSNPINASNTRNSSIAESEPAASIIEESL